MGIGSSSLEDRLFDKVVTLLSDDQKQHAPVIAGMLLEMGEKNVQNLLQSDDLLRAAIDKCLHVYMTKQDHGENIPDQSVDNVRTDKAVFGDIPGDNGRTDKAVNGDIPGDNVRIAVPTVGDILYEKVEKLCPDQAAKITGMLLELDRTSLENLLVSDTSLQSAVQRAQEVCTDNTCSSNDADQSQTLGNRLYEQVEKIYPDHAAKITGMILEQPADKVYRVIHNEKQLLEYTQIAYDTILALAQPSLEPT